MWLAQSIVLIVGQIEPAQTNAARVNLSTPTRKNPLYQKVAPVKPRLRSSIDGTIFDNFQRSRMQGVQDQTRTEARSERQTEHGAAWKKLNKFLYSKKNLAKDTVILVLKN